MADKTQNYLAWKEGYSPSKEDNYFKRDTEDYRQKMKNASDKIKEKKEEKKKEEKMKEMYQQYARENISK